MEINNAVSQNVYSGGMTSEGQIPEQLKPYTFRKGNQAAKKGDLPLTERLFIRLDKNQIGKLDKLARETNLTRSEVIRSFLDSINPS